METDTILGIIAGCLVFLLVFGMVGFFTLSNKQECPKCPNLTCPECIPVIQNITSEVVIYKDIDYKQKVVDSFFEELKEDKDLRYCNDVKYKVDEIELKKLYSGFNLTEDSDDELSISEVKFKINYDEGKCYKTLVCGLNQENELVCE